MLRSGPDVSGLCLGIRALKVISLFAPGYSPFPLLNLQKEYCIYTLYIKEHKDCENIKTKSKKSRMHFANLHFSDSQDFSRINVLSFSLFFFVQASQDTLHVLFS